jgi:hypothetical protein
MSATEAYIKAGYEAKSAGQNVLKLIKNDNIAEIIENRKAEISKNVDNKIALAEEEAFLGILNIGRNGENDFAKLKAWQDILDRRRGKAKQAIDVGGQKDNPLNTTLTILNASEVINNKPKILDEDD